MLAKSKSFKRFVPIFGKKNGSFSPTIIVRKKVVKILKTKKNLTAIKLGFSYLRTLCKGILCGCKGDHRES